MTNKKQIQIIAEPGKQELFIVGVSATFLRLDTVLIFFLILLKFSYFYLIRYHCLRVELKKQVYEKSSFCQSNREFVILRFRKRTFSQICC